MRQPEDRGFSEALLSLRGWAALMVLIFHAAMVFPIDGKDFSGTMHWLPIDTDWGTWLRDWIILPTYGSAWVAFFFVHSGFVLSLTLSRQGVLLPAGIGSFYLRRFFRLWPMIIVSCLATSAYLATDLAPATSSVFSAWFRSLYSGPMEQNGLLANIALAKIGLNPFFWSLKTEAAGSFLMPIFVLFGQRYLRLYCALLLGYGAIALLSPMLPTVASAALGPAKIVNMLGIATGAMLPFLYPEVIRLSRAVNGTFLLCLSAAALVLAPALAWESHVVLTIETIAAALIVFNVYYASDGPVHRLCRLPAMRFYGAISYSFYVNSLVSVHVAALAIARISPPDAIRSYGLLANIACIMLALAINTPLSWLTYTVIERPGIALGKRLLTWRAISSADTLPIPGRTAPR